ncbi:dTDP-glucose 4,6-dehydratase [Shewanella sp. Actino-trap-3]|uniref:PhoX family protein n=1 Tax=Shewanella sp. Actino-trap-3 TaxID=2058331 RepID=UPI000C338007|nr:PhoX family phosphatase [Shewanella sp. Actino-trap-3]PKG78731.1 dTDP-glucose 4,6-dehydratase [Shewanella sp. Actino-trap-3]
MSKATFDPTRFNNSKNTPFNEVMDNHLSRRNFVKRGLGLSAMTAFGGFGLSACGSDNDTAAQTPTPPSAATAPVAPIQSSAVLGFESIAGSKTDAVVVPAGYSAYVLAPWGTPLNSKAAAWKADGSNTAIDQENSVGMHHDGMHFFPLNDAADDGLLCINHEYIDQDALHPSGPTFDADGKRSVIDEIRKEINAHGISVVRIKLVNNLWQVVENDSHNRRFTGATVMDIAGPLAYSSYLETRYSPDGSQARGTLNNCGNGYTPWGTYLTCEENWPGYFVNKGALTEQQTRIGISTSDTRYGWNHLAGDDDERLDEFARFDVTPTGSNAANDYRNEANGHGYIVEIDPYNPNSRATKRTALGRFRHEGCAFGKLEEGKPISFYSGHDSRFEYLYKYVSDAAWDPVDANSTNRLTVGDKYMNAGTLYVAKFTEDGIGEWLPLTLDGVTTDGSTLAGTFDSQAAIILNTAGAADLVGATPMDRPEWTTVDPFTGTVYLTLTNNTKRTDSTNVANPRLNNSFGHVIRWNEGDSATEFSWDIFVFGSPTDGDAETNLSGLTDLNQFASPDGVSFDQRGILWVQTDNGASEVTEATNDQMLAIVPSAMLDADGNQQVVTAENQTQLKRFFVGPNGCEVTGFAITLDYTTVFANIQHPSNWPYSDKADQATPAGTLVRPRAATVMIRKNDGGEVGI